MIDNDAIQNCILEALKEADLRVMSIQLHPLTKVWHINLADRHEQIRFNPSPGSTLEECRHQFRKMMELEAPIIEEEIDNLRRGSPDNLLSAMYRLKKAGEPAIEPLLQILLNENESGFFRERVAQTLAQLDDAKSIETLIKKLNDKDHRIRWHAINALAEVGDRSAIEPLNQLIAVETAIYSIKPTFQGSLKKAAEIAVSQIMARVK